MHGVAGFLGFLGSFVSYVNFDRRIEHMDFKRHYIAAMASDKEVIGCSMIADQKCVEWRSSKYPFNRTTMYDNCEVKRLSHSVVNAFLPKKMGWTILLLQN